MMLKCWKENGQPGFLDSVKNTRHEAKQTLLQAKMRKSYTTKNTEESSSGRKNTIQGGKTEIYPENEGDMPRGVKANKRKTYFQKIIDQSAPVMKILASFYKTILQSPQQSEINVQHVGKWSMYFTTQGIEPILYNNY